MIIDTHLHVWSGDFERFPFAGGRRAAEGAPVEMLVETMEEAGVDRAVIVQPIHYLYDNRYVAECLERYPGKFAAVGLVDRKAPDAPEQLERLVREEGFGGLRIHLSRPDDPAEWAAPDQDRIWEKAAALGSTFIIYGPASLLPAVEPIVARFPEVKVALDHNGGAPPNEEDAGRPLLNTVLGFARYPNVHVKFSPQGHRSEREFPHPDTFDLYRRLYDGYGPRRLMWGTNFPGVLEAMGYARALELFRDHLGFLSGEDREWLFHRTAESLWDFGA